MSDVWLLRLAILVAGIVLFGAIIYFGQPRKGGQGRRRAGEGGERVEPRISDQFAHGIGVRDDTEQPELDLGDEAPNASSDLGRRPDDAFDKIVTIYIAAHAGEKLRGPDIVVAAEKAGLTYGHMNVFHRLVEGHPERGPVFSVANIMKPGSFDMASIQELETPAIAFFLTLPAPVSALDAWEMMQPTAERMADLLGGVVLDESRNALSRQRVQGIRDELRAYDRQREAPPLKPARW
ncbi:cell division protein ZipA [Pseudoluteimonas lycopersici]|uniref:Cell division protein ZipA n=1 Tax=Pseudoluteimonas lycopersici TaxID=1324796 RepID=A0A516V2M4_9GAMM|nr:cell division protein ZipA [Lysobacter lycopersici]QDQ72779.1 cell division protein ZipA [Lysobacter lycopersici]